MIQILATRSRSLGRWLALSSLLLVLVAASELGSQYRLMAVCNTDVLHEPTTTKQVARIIAGYYARQSNTSSAKISVRVSRPYHHSTSTFPCPAVPAPSSSSDDTAEAGLPAFMTAAEAATASFSAAATTTSSSSSSLLQIGILNTKLTRVLGVDRDKRTLRVQAGMTVSQLTAAATKYNMSVQIGTLPVYSNLTLGGVFLTAAHGTAFMTVHSLVDTVLEATWVDGTGKVRTARRGTDEFRALPGSLGRLGVLTELLVQLTAPTATTVVTTNSDDSGLFQKVQQLLQQSRNTMVIWQIDAGLIRAFQLFQAAPGAKVERRARMDLLAGRPGQEQGTAVCEVAGPRAGCLECDRERGLHLQQFRLPADHLQRPGTFWASVEGVGVYNVTGPTNAMQSADCGSGCVWASDFTTLDAMWHDVDLAIELDQLEGLIADIKRIISVELREDGKAPKRCLVNGFFTLRFGQPSDSLIGMTAGMRQPVFVQSAWYRSNKHPDMPIHYQFVADLIEELLLCKYNARPHPGKNFDRTFSHPRCPIAPKYPKLPELLQQAQRYDPAGLFRSDLFDKMVQGRPFQLTPRCTLTQQCYCQADEHCPEGFACVPSLAFPSFTKLCKSPMVDKPGSVWSLVNPVG